LELGLISGNWNQTQTQFWNWNQNFLKLKHSCVFFQGIEL
jgi:hypothetical protein